MKFVPVIFIGPSLPLHEARTLIDADFRPPAKRGDLLDCVRSGHRVVGLIDGYFLQEYPPSPHEVYTAVQSGVTIFGGASLGALRAVELERFGVCGVGQVYNDYRSGAIDGDDEVALTFDPQTFIPLSEPLINIRYTLQRAVDEQLLTDHERIRIIHRLKHMPFHERNYSVVLEECFSYPSQSMIKQLETFLRTHRRDVKAEDAATVLRAVSSYVLDDGNAHFREQIKRM